LFSLAKAFEAVYDTLPESICPRPPISQSSGLKSCGETALWRLRPEDKPEPLSIPSLPLSETVKDTFLKCDAASRTSSDPNWQLPAKVLKELIHAGAYRPPRPDPVSGLDLGSTASLDPDAARAYLPKVPPSTRVSLPLSLLEKWELKQRQCLGLASQLEFFLATIIELTAREDVDVEQLHQVVLYLSRSTSNLAAVASSSLSEILRLRRATVLSRTPKFLLESSREKLLTAPLASPFLFGGSVGEIVTADKDAQIHASVAGRSYPIRSELKKRKSSSTRDSFSGPPSKKPARSKQTSFSRDEPSFSRDQPSFTKDQPFSSDRASSFARGNGYPRPSSSRGGTSRGRGTTRGTSRGTKWTTTPTKARP